MLLEATLENATKAGMLLDTVTFLPSPPWAAERIGGGGASAIPPAPAGGSPGAGTAPGGTLRCGAGSAVPTASISIPAPTILKLFSLLAPAAAPTCRRCR